MGAKRTYQRLKDKLANQPKPDPTRTLILADPEKKNNLKEWQAEVDRTTNKGWEKTAKEIGYPALIGGPIAFDNDPRDNLNFPPDFCVYCGQHNLPKKTLSKGLFVFNNGYPELGIKAQTRATHYMCHPCADECVFPTRDTGLHLPDRVWKDARTEWHVRAELNMVGYVKAQRDKGIEGNIFGDEERRRSLSDA